ncbi:N-acetyltransferase family protein [Nonomuraea sp. CA-143628]|uniref:GNAT family N-acetyltransferase n=1 Tax=Nonomuraea sp. CA-143628 TaxID=3239997 RepID=UPI003D8CBC96
MSIEFHHRTGAAAADAVLGEVYADTYETIYSEPPYNSHPPYTRALFTERTIAQAQRPGFELVSAEDGLSLAGFCFGFTMESGRWWGSATTPVPDGVVAVPKLAVIELILRKEYRGNGVGKRLLSELLADRAEPYATLASHPDAPAHAMYERWGWHVVGSSQPRPDSSTADFMLIELRRNLR